MLGRQLGERRLKLPLVLAALRVARGIVVAGPLMTGLEQRIERRLRPALAPAMERIREIDRDAREPRIQGLTHTEPRDRLPGADEGFLGEIVGIAAVPGESIGHTVD